MELPGLNLPVPEAPMPLNRVLEDHEVGPELRRIFSEVRTGFDLPFVPTLFRTLAGIPEYLRPMWRDLGPVVSSREFQASALALDEFVRSLAITGGWRFGDQERILAEQKVSTSDMPVLAGVMGIFAREIPRMLLFARLLQRGYSGGQRGRISAGKQSPALSRLVTVHVPAEREASLRVWLIFSDIKRTTGVKQIPSFLRTLSPFPGYLASSWMSAKELVKNNDFAHARNEIARRSAGLATGLPVRDHKAFANHVTPEQWMEIEEVVDRYVRLLPQFALLCSVWRRSFSTAAGQSRAA